MGKHKQFRNYEGTLMWANRINFLLEEKNITQKELADTIGVSEGTISHWIGEKRAGNPAIPSIDNFQKVAEFFDVSLDYLSGKSECKRPENENIQNVTGLSEKAIENLKELHKKQKKNGFQRKHYSCNYLLEHINNSTLFQYLYDYLFGEFKFHADEMAISDGGFFISTIDGTKRKQMYTADLLQDAFIVKIQNDLFKIKEELNETKSKKTVWGEGAAK